LGIWSTGFNPGFGRPRKGVGRKKFGLKTKKRKGLIWKKSFFPKIFSAFPLSFGLGKENPTGQKKRVFNFGYFTQGRKEEEGFKIPSFGGGLI